MSYKEYKVKESSIEKMKATKSKFVSKKKKDFICVNCNSSFKDFKTRDRKYCSQKCVKEIGNGTFKQGLTAWNKGTKGVIKSTIKGKKIPERSGKNHFRWIEDRTKLKKDNRRNDSSYREWRINVYKRDDFVCKLENKDCNGRIEAHHILGWKEYPELRYDIKNGITLCHFHHPRKRVDEIANINKFNNLINK